MKLGGRLTLGFLVVAALPIAGGAWVAHHEVAARYRDEFERTLTLEEAHAKRAYSELSAEVTQAGTRLARADSPMLSQLAPELAKGELDDEFQRQLMARAPEEMRAHGLDVLTVYDDKGTVLACGHFLGHVGDVDSGFTFGRAKDGASPHLMFEKILAAGAAAPRSELIVASLLPVEIHAGGARVRVTVLAGRRLVPDLPLRIHVPARVVGQGVSAPELAPGARGVVWLGQIAGQGDIDLEISVPRDELELAQRWIRQGAAALVAATTLLALALGAWMARRVSRPIRALTDEVRALAEGRPTKPLGIRTRDEVGELAGAFDKMTNDLEAARAGLLRAERIAAWREIAQRIAHEIKNPLSPIQMAIETMQRVRRGEAKGKVDFDKLFDESTVTILSEVARLRHIVAEFSRFARMPSPTLASLELNPLIEHVLGLYASLPHSIARELAAPPPVIMGDRDQLTQVLVNLLENARDAVATREHGAIAVSTVLDPGCAVSIVIADNGQGMSADVRAQLFTPYFTTKPKGTGLGLAIVHRIVTDHGGTITVESTPGEGSSFRVRLPVGGRET